MDYELQNHYRIIARVRNPHVSEKLRIYHTEEAKTIIKVLVDDEDEPPIFPLPYYIFEIFEESPLGSAVGMVSAIDPDAKKSPIG